jgi:hypothetical protein
VVAEAQGVSRSAISRWVRIHAPDGIEQAFADFSEGMAA